MTGDGVREGAGATVGLAGGVRLKNEKILINIYIV
jgi:hypothetical protein